MVGMSKLVETRFLERALMYEVPTDPKSKALKLPANADPDARKEYLDILSCELLKCVAEDDCSLCYLALQPIWRVCKDNYYLAGAEVLVRVKNGTDSAPMPGLAWFQTQRKKEAALFLQGQISFASKAALALPNIYISVNVRPDELADVADLMVDAARETAEKCGHRSNLIFEITEYAPISKQVLKTIEDMKSKGVRFSLDDVSYDSPNHACTFQLAREQGQLFEQQKLALPISFKAFDVDVFPTPSYAGGEPLAFFTSQRLRADDQDSITKLKSDVEGWVSDARASNPDVEFVIEASVHPEDLKPGRSPDVDFLKGVFLVQGGHTGGRAFPASMFVEPE